MNIQGGYDYQGELPALPDVELPVELRWRVHTLDVGESLDGWTAGPALRVCTHWSGGRTLVCAAWMTGGIIQCPCQQSPMSRRVTGYQPVVTRAGDRVVMILAATVAAKVHQWGHATPIRITRTGRDRRPLQVVQLAQDSLSATMRTHLLRVGPQRINRYLCHLWQHRELCEHFGFPWRPSAATQTSLGETPDAA